MTVPALWVCSQCGRDTFVDGVKYRVEAARDRDGEMQAAAFFDALLSSSKADQRRAIDAYFRLKDYAQHGSLPIPRELNHLRNDIWEIKAGDVRLPLFNASFEEVEHTRLTHGFKKNTKKTPRGEIDRAEGIQREDGTQ